MKQPLKRPWLLPLTPLWAAGAAWKNHTFDSHSAKAQQLQRSVISVGSLSAGGAGKTPFVIALGKALQQRGIPVDVLSRGYGRTTSVAARVNLDGSADHFGDEPMLLARALQSPVYVASQRVEAGRLAEADSENAAQVHLLDDGFQHRQLARTVDIVLLTAQDVQDTLLPSGDLREPLQSLRRAHVIVLRAEESEALQPVLQRIFHSGQPPAVWHIERQFTVETPSQRPLAFCGIARPRGFQHSLAAHGITPAAFIAWRDHQRYTRSTVDRLLRSARQSGADGFVTTAKDAVKLSPSLQATLAVIGPLTVADIEVRIREEKQCVSTLLQMLSAASSS